MRLIANIEGPTADINIPRINPKNGEEWKKIRLIKMKYNLLSTNIDTNRFFLINVEETENNGYFTTSGGNVIKYAFSYILTTETSEEIRLLNNDIEIYQNFNKTRTDKLKISIYDKNGPQNNIDISSTFYIIMEFELV